MVVKYWEVARTEAPSTMCQTSEHSTAASHYPNLCRHTKTHTGPRGRWFHTLTLVLFKGSLRNLTTGPVGQRQAKLLDQIHVGNAVLTKVKEMALLQVISEPSMCCCEFAKKKNTASDVFQSQLNTGCFFFSISHIRR